MNKILIVIAALISVTSCNNGEESQLLFQKQNTEIQELRSEIELLKKEIKNLPPIIGQRKQLEAILTRTNHGDMSDYVQFSDKSNNENTYTFAWWSWKLKNTDISSFVNSSQNKTGQQFTILIEYQELEEIAYRPDLNLGYSVNVKTGKTINKWVLTGLNTKIDSLVK
jgi:hypothetical protein